MIQIEAFITPTLHSYDWVNSYKMKKVQQGKRKSTYEFQSSFEIKPIQKLRSIVRIAEHIKVSDTLKQNINTY